MAGKKLRLGIGVAVAVSAIRLDERSSANPKCQCLDFSEVYASGLAVCGMALELLPLAFEPKLKMECQPKLSDLASVTSTLDSDARCGREALRKLDLDNCASFPDVPHSSFFENQRHRYCVKVSDSILPSSKLYSQFWCYVSSECDQLNHGARINNNVSWKVCNSREDAFLGDLDPPTLCSLQDLIRPAGSGRGGCRLAALKAYDMGGGTIDKAIEHDPRILQPTHRPLYWAGADYTAVVQHGRKRWAIFWDWKQETCVQGCR
mmetsp:Transcript_36614/g.85198  ORF Transcript_36614/g.85198 Transcript_36614/m.85198 type:complete len:263 (+) Transcript_36614:61-849(+)